MRAAVIRVTAVGFVVTAAILISFLVLAAPAPAASDTVVDGTGDVVSVRPKTEHPAPQARFADVIGLTSIYRRQDLTLKTTLRELVERPALVLYIGVDIETSAGESFVGQLIITSDHRVSSRLLLGDDLPKPCNVAALKSRVDQHASTISFVIPTRCLGHPRWVRTGASSYVDAKNGNRSWRDDARAPYRETDFGGIYAAPTYGPEIHLD